MKHAAARRVVALCIAVAVGGCGSGSSETSGSDGLDGRTFLSQAVDGHTLVPGTEIRLSFDDGRVNASAGCNSLSAPYALTGGRLVIRGGMSTTDMGCDPPRHNQDEWLAGVLQGEPRIDLEADTLTLRATNATLRFLDRVVADPDRPLIGTRWTVDTVIRDQTASSVPGARPVTLEFRDDGTVTATSTGCSTATVTVDVDEGSHTLRFEPFALDAIGCPTPWEETVAVLRSATVIYSISATRLTLTAGRIGVAAVAA